ncbi:replication initiation protein [Chryseobacterium rhizosphaerae]|uniref:replication initiation protein n=1 Tax=Chryseobacterium rhizosphaerae TaxID=395937 RepID=UPI00286C88AB|nr:replication initiation protein [Chryseobacterium rhizosphaerae]
MNNGHLIQTNFINQTILNGVSEVQKAMIYHLQGTIDYFDESANGEAVLDYNEFIKNKGVIRNNTYTPEEIERMLESLKSTNGVIYNINTKQIEYFNLIDKVGISPDDPEKFNITFASWGKIFFFERFAKEYAEKSKISYTQLERSIISISGDKKMKFYELFSQWRNTGWFIIELEKLRVFLGFSIYENIDLSEINNRFSSELFKENNNKEIELFYENRVAKHILYPRWIDLRRKFIEPAISDFESNPRLKIKNISFDLIKRQNKVHSLKFTFNKRVDHDELTEAQKNSLRVYVDYGLNAKQVLYLFNIIGLEEMDRRIKTMIYFNPRYNDSKGSPYRNRNIFFDKSTDNPIENLGGFLYEIVFPELKSNN